MTTDDSTATRTKRPDDPLAAPGRMSARARRGVIAGCAIVAVLVLFATLFVTKTWPFSSGAREEAVEFLSSDGTKVTVRARVIPGSLRIIAEPQVLTSTAWKALTPPVRIEAQGLEGAFNVTFTPGPSVGGGPDSGEMLCLSPTGGTTPVGSQTQADGTMVADTTCGIVTVGRLEEPEVDKAVSTPLDQSADTSDPVVAALLGGRRTQAACSSDHVLVGGQGANDTDPLCVEYLADRDAYRVAYNNWDGVPYAFRLHDGVTRTTNATAQPPEDPLAAYLSGGRDTRTALVPPSGTFEAGYPPSAASPGATMVGRPDAAGWILYGLRENLMATAGLNQIGKRIPEAVTLVDRSVAAEPVTQCASKAASGLGDSSTIQNVVTAVRSGYSACLPMAVTALAATYAEHNGGNAERITKRITATIASADKHAVRADTSFQKVMLGASEDAKATDKVTRLIPMPRFMTKDEVFALPPTSPRGDWDASRCPAPPEEGQPRPAGVAREAECLYILEADLDGNGKPDRAMTWTSGRPDGRAVRDPDPGRRQGAVAYLDGGRVATLPASEADADWLGDFEALRGAYLGNDKRQQLVVEIDDAGAHTVRSVVLGLGSDFSLHLARLESGQAFTLAVDGSVSSGGAYGCYAREGRGRIAHWRWTRTGQVSDSLSRIPGDMRVTPLELNDLVVKRVGDDLNYVTPGHPNAVDHPVGGECNQANPAQRGPYAVNVPGALSRADRESAVRGAVQRGLTAVTSGDVGAIQVAFAPEAQAEAIATARKAAGLSPLRRGMTCNWASMPNHLGLDEEASCNATFEVETAWLDVSVGRDAGGKYRAVGVELIRP